MDKRLKAVFFGIEFETCICDKEADMDGFEKTTAKLQAIANDKKVNCRFRYQENPRADIDYTKWSVTRDGSIICGRNAYGTSERNFFSKGIRSTNDCKFTETAVEIVTPIYNYYSDYALFNSVLENVIFSGQFEYVSNPSQGMHINTSYLGREYDPIKVLEMWWYFEPVIVRFVPLIRRSSEFAKPLREIFSSIQDIRDREFSFYRDPDIPPAKYTMLCKKSNRFEFRMINAAMSMDHIMSWLGFCARFMVSSPDFVVPETRDTGTFDELFSYIKNYDLKEYFSTIIQQFEVDDRREILIKTKWGYGLFNPDINLKKLLSEDDDSALSKEIKTYIQADVMVNSFINSGDTHQLTQYLTQENAEIVFRNILGNSFNKNDREVIVVFINLILEAYKNLQNIKIIVDADLDDTLLTAAKTGYRTVVEFIVRNGASDEARKLAFYIAIKEGHSDIVKFLIDNGVLALTDIEDAARLAIANRRLDILELLAGSIRSKNSTLLRLSVRNNAGLDIIKFLIDNGADIHVNEEELLKTSVKKGDFDLFMLLVKSGADISVLSNEFVENINMLKFLIDKGAVSVDKELLMAIDNANYTLVEYLLNITTYNSKDLIRLANKKGRWNIAKLIEEKEKAKQDAWRVKMSEEISSDTDYPPMDAPEFREFFTKVAFQNRLDIIEDVMTGSEPQKYKNAVLKILVELQFDDDVLDQIVRGGFATV